jgi:threonyl-tRNA synthetase
VEVSCSSQLYPIQPTQSMVVKNSDFQSAAGELLALAILNIFSSAKIIETYPTELGFGVDFSMPHELDATGFLLIDERLRILIKQDLSITPIEMMRENAAALLKAKGQELLAEKIVGSPENVVSLVRIGEFYGFSCLSEERNSKQIGEAKLVDYFSHSKKLDGKFPVASLEGILRKDTREIKKFIKKYEESKKSDHRSLSEELGLFLISKNAPYGCWTTLPKGEIVKNILTSLWKKSLFQEGYAFVNTAKWYEISGKKPKNDHYLRFMPKNREFAYLSDPDLPFREIFRSKVQSAGSLPLRLAEIFEKPAENPSRRNLGLLTADLFTADISYSFCTQEQAREELISSLQFLLKWIKIFAIDYQCYLVSNDPKTFDNQRSRDQGVSMLKEALQRCECSHVEDSVFFPFRGPHIEARFIDSLGREWRGPSIEVDLSPGDLTYRDGRNKEQRPFVIKRSLFGSLERIVALMLECFDGHLPLWLAPEQVRVIPLKEEHDYYAKEVCEQLCQSGIRAIQDRSEATLAAKVFAVKSAKIPYAIVIGDDEQRNGTIAVCPCKETGKGQQEKVGAFIKKLKDEMKLPLAMDHGPKMELMTD